MTELDDALRDSFARLAEPGDPAGVVDSIRARLDAGDTGTPASSTGFGSGVPWLLWGAVLVISGILGGAVGASGVLGHDTQNVVDIGAVSLSQTTPGHSCPAGPAVGELDRGARVLALGRNADSSWVSVRDPRNLGSTLWVPAALVVVDAGEGPVTGLPLGAPCPTVSLPPIPGQPAAPPAAAPPGKPKGDTVKPKLSGATASNPGICYTGSGFTPTTSVISVTATDNVGVASVKATWSAVGGSPQALTRSGNTWSFTFSSPPVSADTPVVITLTARDAAGNKATTTKTVLVHYNSPPCQLL